MEWYCYMIVVIYINLVIKNIKKWFGKKIVILFNLFIGIIYFFLNKFIVILYLSLYNEDVNGEKLFI